MIIQIVLLIGIATLVMIYTTLKGKSKTGGMGGTGPTHINTLINGHIGSAPVVIFSKSSCPFCTRAKALFRKMGVKFKELELDKMRNGKDLQMTLYKMTNQRTVPNIFVNGEHLGGYDVALRKAKDGSLQRLLNL